MVRNSQLFSIIKGRWAKVWHIFNLSTYKYIIKHKSLLLQGVNIKEYKFTMEVNKRDQRVCTYIAYIYFMLREVLPVCHVMLTLLGLKIPLVKFSKLILLPVILSPGSSGVIKNTVSATSAITARITTREIPTPFQFC